MAQWWGLVPPVILINKSSPMDITTACKENLDHTGHPAGWLMG